MVDFQFRDPDTLKLIYILVIALFLWAATQIFTNTLVKTWADGTPRGRRLRTLSSVIKTVASTAIIALAVFQTLSVVGLDLAPLLASAGIAGLAIGFGAQTLVKDCLSGFFLLIEGQFDEGDEVEISGKRGKVEKITLRTVWIREENGAVHIIPTGSITLVSNFAGVKQKPKK